MNSEEDDEVINPPGVGPFDKDPDDDIPFRGFDENTDE